MKGLKVGRVMAGHHCDRCKRRDVEIREVAAPFDNKGKRFYWYYLCENCVLEAKKPVAVLGPTGFLEAPGRVLRGVGVTILGGGRR